MTAYTLKKWMLAGLVLCLAAAHPSAASPVEDEEPAQTAPDAILFGREITVGEGGARELSGEIFGALMQQFAEENPVEVTDDEIQAFQKSTDDLMQKQIQRMAREAETLRETLDGDTLAGEERTEAENKLKLLEQLQVFLGPENAEERLEAGRGINRHFIMAWKINRALYEKYGGRVIFQQAGVEPLDAYRDLLKEKEAEGAFQILNPAYVDGFWNYFTNDAMHSFYSHDEGEKFMMTPMWELEPDEEDEDD